MKKSILALAVVLGASSTFAQDLTSKKGENYLPEAGDWAVSIDANPILNYVGNFFGKAANNVAPSFGNNTAFGTSVLGKYFVEDEMAYRVGINVNHSSITERALVPNFTTPLEFVEDSKKTTSTAVGVTAGLEWRKGTTRLQGFYGAELNVGVTGASKVAYSYGNEFSVANNTQTNGLDPLLLDTDVREIKTKGALAFGLRGFIGAEYFILPKLALGGEFGLGLGVFGSGEETTIKNDPATVADVSSVTSSKTSNFMLSTNNNQTLFNPTASMKISFYF